MCLKQSFSQCVKEFHSETRNLHTASMNLGMTVEATWDDPPTQESSKFMLGNRGLRLTINQLAAPGAHDGKWVCKWVPSQSKLDNNISIELATVTWI